MEIAALYQIFLDCQTVTTDSRHCPTGSLFIALKGESFNGNRFAAQALKDGCSYAVVDEASYVAEGDQRYILVDDCLQTLQLLATTTVVSWEHQLSELPEPMAKQRPKS